MSKTVKVIIIILCLLILIAAVFLCYVFYNTEAGKR